MFGKRRTMSRCTAATAGPAGTLATTTNCCGARRSASGANTTKKFASKRAQFTVRKLVTIVVTGTPCTFHVTVSPSATPRSVARSRSNETSNGASGLAARTLARVAESANHLPATSASEPTMESR